MNKNELVEVMPIVSCGPNENQILKEFVKPGDAGVVVVSHDVQPSSPDMVQDVLLLRQDEGQDGSTGDHCLWLGVRRGDGDPISSFVKVTEDNLESGELDYALSPGRILHEISPDELVSRTLNTYLTLAEKTIERSDSTNK